MQGGWRRSVALLLPFLRLPTGLRLKRLRVDFALAIGFGLPLAARFGEEQADRVLRWNHEAVFQDWLSLSVREKKNDLDTYLSSIDDNKRLVVETWLRIMTFRNLLPGAARGVEADLFVADFRVLLELLRSEYGAAEPDLGA